MCVNKWRQVSPMYTDVHFPQMNLWTTQLCRTLGTRSSNFKQFPIPKLLKCMFLGFTETQNCFCSLSRVSSITLKPSTFEDVYLNPGGTEASGSRILSNNQLHNIQQLINTHQHLFLKENKQFYNFSIRNRENSELPPILSTCFPKTLDGNNFFFSFNQMTRNFVLTSCLSAFIFKIG